MFGKRKHNLDYVSFMLSISLSFMLGLFGSLLIAIIGMIYIIRYILKYGEYYNVNRNSGCIR